MTVGALIPEQLYRVCACEQFEFRTTDDLEPLAYAPGQERALEAIRFGAEMPHADYHLYLLGQPGTGRHMTAKRLFREEAAQRPTPPDWVYVHNFEEPHRPLAIALPPGRAAAFAEAMRDLVRDVRTAVPAAYERPEVQRRLQGLEESFRGRQEEAFEALGEAAKEQGFALLRTQQGFAFAPLKAPGEAMTQEDFGKLPEAEQKRLQERMAGLQERLKALLQELPRQDKERRRALQALHQEIIAQAIVYPLGEVRTPVADVPAAVAFLDRVRQDLIDNLPALLAAEQAAAGGGEGRDGRPTPPALGTVNGLKRYEVNVLVHNQPDAGAPVVYEDNPTLGNLLGRAEHIAMMGTLVTDFTLLKSGALHRANGGFLILDAEKLLTQPFAWEALKRNLKAGHVSIESPMQYASLVATVSLEPQPVPLKVRIALVGSAMTFHLLQQYDPEFAVMFKVAADFSDRATRNEETDRHFARLVATMVREGGLKPLDVEAVARLIEASSRDAEDAHKLSLNLQNLWDLVREADFLAGKEGAKLVGRRHVSAAVAARIRRADRIREQSHEAITREIMLIDTAGAVAGQINGLSVLQLGRFAFGKPSRITCRVRMGQGRVIDIEREVKLGGPLHSKGVLILQGFIAGRFLPGMPLSVSASLVFEQSYGGVDGDSASSAELYALLSALGELPIRQWLAVTGSVSQQGQVQAIGGVNEKIEGFFDICRARGLSGREGVLIPRANINHLMLREDVVEACRREQFHVYPVATVEEGVELLTGLPAGERGLDGRYPPDSVFGRVEARLVAFDQQRRRIESGSGEKDV